MADEVYLTDHQFQQLLEPLNIIVNRLDAICELLEKPKVINVLTIRETPALAPEEWLQLDVVEPLFSSTQSDGNGKNIDSLRE